MLIVVVTNLVVTKTYIECGHMLVVHGDLHLVNDAFFLSFLFGLTVDQFRRMLGGGGHHMFATSGCVAGSLASGC